MKNKLNVAVGVAVTAVIAALGYFAYTFTDRYKIMKAFGFSNNEYRVFKQLKNCNASGFNPEVESTWNGSFSQCGIKQEDFATATSVLKTIRLNVLASNL